MSWPKSTDPLKNGVSLIVAIGSFAVKPDLLNGLKSGISIHDTLKKMLARPPHGLATMIDQMTGSARAVFDGFGRELPRDADLLYEQMVVATLPDAASMVANNMDADRIRRAMTSKLADREHTRPPVPELFEQLTRPVLARLLADPSFADDLTPAFMAQVLGGLDTLEKKVDDLPERVVEILRAQGVLGQYSATISVERLLVAARHFGEPVELSADGLLKFLRQKAEDLIRISSEIKAMRGLSEKIDNVVTEAAEAAREGCILQARELLDGARELQVELLRRPLEVNATLNEELAELDLAEGKAEDAYQKLAIAADSFVTIDPLEPARRRILIYFPFLRKHGFRYGGAGLSLSRRLIEPAIGEETKSRDPWLWAAGVNSQAVSFSEQGARTAGPEGMALLNQAVTAYRDALTVRTRSAYSMEWAATQQNLGIALETLGKRSEGPEGAAFLSKSFAAFRSALEVMTRDEHPIDWATIQQNLGIALKVLGIRTSDPEGTSLLTQAIGAYLEVKKRKTFPEDWAVIKQNLGSAFAILGGRTPGPEGAELLAKASAAYHDALAVMTLPSRPMDWAATMENMALAEAISANHDTTSDPRPHLEAALHHVEAALTVFDQGHMPFNYEKAAHLRDHIKTRLDSLDD